MGLIDLQRVIRNLNTIAFDTAPIIYFVEENPRYFNLVEYIFECIETRRIGGYTSVLSLSETLVYPYRFSLPILENSYKNLLLHSDNFHTIPIDENIAIQTAQLRAKYTSIKVPDLIQVATALSQGCDAFLTNDRQLKMITEIDVLVLEDFIA